MNDSKITALARQHLPSFCTITRVFVREEFDPKAAGKSTKAMCANFTFPGAQGEGFWSSLRPGMATVDEDDYETYQQLKDQWRAEKRSTK